MSRLSITRQAQIFGLLGLIPFVTLGALYPLWPASDQARVVQVFIAYAAVILAFMAGALWLPAILKQHSDGINSLPLAIALSLLAFLVLLLPLPLSLLLSVLGFLLLLAGEMHQHWQRRYPPWYWQLRLVLTATVVTCHLLLGLWLWL